MFIQSTKKLQDMLVINSIELPTDIESFDSWHGNVFMIRLLAKLENVV